MVYLAADTANFKRNMDGAERSAKSFGSTANKVGANVAKVLGPALIAAGVAAAAMAVKFGVDGVNAFVDDEAAAAKLATTLGNLGFEKATADVENMIDAQQRATGVADDELRPAFDRLVRATKDVGEATTVLKLAQDIAAGTGKKLEAVTDALGRAYDGTTTGLSRLGAGLDTATLATGDMKVIIQALTDTFAGQAQTAANTYRGQVDRLAVAFGELQESFGRGFITSLTAATTGTNDLMDAMKDLEPAAEDVGNELARIIIKSVDFGRKTQNLLTPINNFENASTRVFLEFSRQVTSGTLDVERLGDALAGVLGQDVSGFAGGASVGGGRGGGTGGSFGGPGVGMPTLRPNDPSVIRANAAAHWAKVLNDLNPKLDENTKVSGKSAKATASIRDAMAAAAQKVTNMFAPALDEAKSNLEAVSQASTDYAASLAGAITGTLSLAAAWSTAERKAKPGEAFAAEALTAFQKQIGDATGFATAIGALAKDPSVSKTLIDQLVAVAQSEGPIAGTVLANEIISTGMAPELSKQLNALDVFAGKTGEEVSKKFYNQGLQSAVDILEGITTEIAAQKKQLKRLGKNIGEPIGNEVTREISEAIDRGIARAKKAAADAEAAAFTQQTAARATQTAIGTGITAIVRQTDQRTGTLPASALR